MDLNLTHIKENSSLTTAQNNSVSAAPLLERCTTLHLMGTYLVVLFLTSLMANVYNLWLFQRQNVLRTPIMFFMRTLILLNLLGTFVQLPLVTINAFNGKWSFSRTACRCSGFLMYFIGCMSIYLLVGISFERYTIMHSISFARVFSNKLCCTIVIICGLCSAFWATMPLYGWSYYSLDALNISCSVEWHARTPNVTSYNVSIFVFVFVVPTVIIVYTNAQIIHRMLTIKIEEADVQERYQKQRRVTIVTILFVVFFLISWTPYACVSMYSAFIDEHAIGPVMSSTPALFAKSSLAWPALLNILFNLNQ